MSLIAPDRLREPERTLPDLREDHAVHAAGEGRLTAHHDVGDHAEGPHIDGLGVRSYVFSSFFLIFGIFSDSFGYFLANFERPVLGCIDATFCN